MRENNEYTKIARKAVKEEKFREMCKQWCAYLERPNIPGEYTKLAIVSRLTEWLEYKVGTLSFHITKVMTGHGCFGFCTGSTKEQTALVTSAAKRTTPHIL